MSGLGNFLKNKNIIIIILRHISSGDIEGIYANLDLQSFLQQSNNFENPSLVRATESIGNFRFFHSRSRVDATTNFPFPAKRRQKRFMFVTRRRRNAKDASLVEVRDISNRFLCTWWYVKENYFEERKLKIKSAPVTS